MKIHNDESRAARHRALDDFRDAIREMGRRITEGEATLSEAVGEAESICRAFLDDLSGARRTVRDLARDLGFEETTDDDCWIGAWRDAPGALDEMLACPLDSGCGREIDRVLRSAHAFLASLDPATTRSCAQLRCHIISALSHETRIMWTG